ncbi:hypothetical protein CC78DRAFT_593725 [Lojkania enalia]|uniref:Uncharacterized protein n=1 Tax=Lojkania enalia TaxID=147567 RepID=A0A9P4N2F0_9PLEO|nr:hypothetical protein CC78DRAFT_593725 [Didymosphaeria enalia]
MIFQNREKNGDHDLTHLDAEAEIRQALLKDLLHSGYTDKLKRDAAHSVEQPMSGSSSDRIVRIYRKENIEALLPDEWDDVFRILDTNIGLVPEETNATVDETIDKSDIPANLQKSRLEDGSTKTEGVDAQDQISFESIRCMQANSTDKGDTVRHCDHQGSCEECDGRVHGKSSELHESYELGSLDQTQDLNQNHEPEQQLMSEQDGIYEKLKIKIQELERQIDALKDDCMDKYWLSTALARKVLQLHKEVGDLRAQMISAEEVLKDLDELNAKLERNWKKAASALTELRRQNSNYTIDDQTVKHSYSEIIYETGNWASNYCTGKPSLGLTSQDWDRLCTLTADPERYLQSKRLRPLLIQSLIMKMLAADVLNFSEHVGLLWAGDFSPSLRKLSSALYFVNEVHVNRLIEDYSSALKVHLQPFVTAHDRSIWKDLQEIVRKATRLDEELHKSRAIFKFDTWAGKGDNLRKGGYDFQDSIMQSATGFKEGQEGMTAELLLAPRLLKTGTADGDSFEKSICLAKWIVVCKEGRMKAEKR